MKKNPTLLACAILFAGSPAVWSQESIAEVLADPALDLRVPAQRALAVERVRALENRGLQRARAKANAMGVPMRRELPNGVVQEIVGLNEKGEFLIYTTDNVNAAISTAVNLVNASPYNLNGNGMTVGVWDGGAVRNTHQEFATGSRVTIMDGAAFNDHATHVAGTIAAAGVVANAKGMATQALVHSYDWNSDTSEMTTRAATGPAQADKIYVSNHSYGYVEGWDGNQWTGTGTDQNAYDPQFGQYSSAARNWDLVAFNAPYYLPFKSAGNDNSNNPSTGSSVIIGGQTVAYDPNIHPKGDGLYRNATTSSANGYETIGSNGTAKNIMTVGAANDAVTSGLRDPSKSTLTGFSSRGPTDDGRIKPDIVANGAGLYSPVSGSNNTSYASYNGTSMSSPNATGSASLLVQHYANLFSGGAMRASTLKGLIIHTATDIGNPGPDYHYGWGLMNTKEAADLISDHQANPSKRRMTEDLVTTTTQTKSYSFTWDGVSALRASLCWTDPAGTSTSTHDLRTARLVNNLDLKLIAPNGTQYYPYTMPFVGTWTVASMSLNATTGVNNTDNVEQVYLQNPGQTGTWQAVVTYQGTLTNSQQYFSLLISGSQDDNVTFAVNSMSPSSGTTGTSITADIIGIGLGTNTQVRLTRAGSADIPGTSLQMISANTLRCQFDLTGAAIGMWDLVVTSPTPETRTLTNALEVRTTLEMALDTAGINWTGGGNLPWFPQTAVAQDGIDAAQSGSIADNQTSSLSTTLTGPGTLTFQWKVSSESGYDFLRFFLNGVEQTGSLARISGEVDWVQKTVSLPAGSSSVEWRYTKDGSVSTGSDAAWLDQVVFVPENTPGSLAVTPAGGLTASGGFGGPFAPSSLQFTLSNTGGNPISWAAAKTQGWVTLNTTSGTLAAGASTTVTATINSGANTLGIGSYSDNVTFTNATNGNGNTIRPVALTVNPVAATVTLGNLNPTYDGTPKAASVTTSPAGLAHTVTYNGSGTVPVNAGTYAVVATITEPNFTGSASGNLVINKASQSIAFGALAPVPDDAAPFSLTATAGSGLAVSYTSSNAAVATVSGSTVTLTGVGTTTITAAQAGNTNYNPAASVQQTLTVVRSNPLAVAGGPYIVLVGQSLALDGSASLPSDGATVTTYAWDLNNDGTFGDVTGATPSAIGYADLTTTWGMAQGINTIALRVTDSAGKFSTITAAVEIISGLTWDSNGATAGQTNGAGAWLGTNLWWNGSSNQSWVGGSNATFGGPNTAGGAVTLASPTSVNLITLIAYTGSYTLGSSGQSLTISGGIHKTPASSSASIASPVSLGAPQTWANDSATTLATGNGTNLITNNGHDLTIDGSGPVNLGVINNTAVTLAGSGALIKNGTGLLSVGGVNVDFSGPVAINGGTLRMTNNTGGLGSGNITLNGGILEAYWGLTLTRSLGSGPGEIQITGGASGFSQNGNNQTITITLNNSSAFEAIWGSSFFNPTTLVLSGDTAQGASSAVLNNRLDLNGATRTVHVSSGTTGQARAIIAGQIRNSAGIAGFEKTGDGILTLSSGSNAWNGSTVVHGGVLDLAGMTAANLGGGSGRNVTIAAGAGIRFNALSNAFLNRLVETPDEITVMTGGTANNLDFSGGSGANLPNAFLGNWASNGSKTEYSGTLTPAADAYRLGGIRSNGLLGIVGTNKLSGTQGLIVGGTGGSGIRVELAGANDFTGDTLINPGAKLTLGNNLALQNSTLDLGSGGGTFALSNGLLTGRTTGSTASPSPTFGGLTGSRNLLAAFSTAAGNNEQLLAASAVTGFTLNLASGKVVEYAGGIADFATGTTLTKTGAGTQILSGVNTYTGATGILGGTLAITGNTLATSAITFANDAALGLAIGTPVNAAAAAVDFTGGTIAISGTPETTSHVLLTAASMAGTPVLAAPVPGYELVVEGNQLFLNAAAPPDTTAPTLAGIHDDQGGSAVLVNSTVTYTVTFSEPIDAATVSAADFGNAGTASGAINSVIQIAADAFAVAVTPTSGGTLQLRINAGAQMEDLAGNSLDTATALLDDTVITVTVPNSAPVAVSQNVGTAEDTAVAITLTATDADGDPYTYTVLSAPANGTLSGTAPNLTYTPAANYHGTDGFTFKVNDGTVDSNTASVSITVTPVNDAPVALAQNVTTAEDTAVAITLTGSDPDGGSFTYAIVSPPANGTLGGSAPNLTFTPSTNFSGTTSFTFKVNDGTVDSAPATVAITVTPVNDAPVFTVNPIVLAAAGEDTPYTGQTLAGRATDPDSGDTLSYSKISGPAWLSVAPDGTLSGTPPSGSAGLNSFVVRATDSATATADASLEITVTGLPLPWASTDIGTGMLAGSVGFSGGTFTQAGSGVIGGNTDKLHYTYQTLSGDGEIIARITSLQNTGNSSRVGVMIRESLAANSKQVFMGLTGSGGYRWARRTATGGSTSSTNSGSGTVPNTWVRLVRSGNTITAYKSTNGTSWTTVGSTTNTTFGATCYIGLAVGSGSTTTLNTSQFGNVSVTP